MEQLSAHFFKTMIIRIVQKKETIYKNGKSPLFLRFTHERKNKFVSTGIAVLTEHWNYKEQQIEIGCTNSNAYNAQIKGKLHYQNL